MDKHQQPSPLAVEATSSLPPAQLWIGSEQDVLNKIHQYMQQRWCPMHGCTQCITCKQIMEHQYHKALWICPEGNYTREDLEPIFDMIKFEQNELSELIIVIQRADYLSPACYNSLLKAIEEPPLGYHFLLTARRIKEVADTIRSRCIISNLSSTHNALDNPLAKVFTQEMYSSPHDFIDILEAEDPDEHQSKELIDALLLYWITQYKTALKASNNQADHHIEYLMKLFEQALKEPPMPGSSKLFWKNLFVQFKN